MTELKTNPEKAVARFPEFGAFLTPNRFFNRDPFTLMRQITEEMDRAFGGPALTTNKNEAWYPAVEVKRQNGKLLISAELPGLKKEDIKVRVTGETLVLEGERKEEKEQKEKGYYHSERSYGRFYREIPLPEGAQIDKVTAEFANGVLDITMPAPEAKKTPREIPVAEGGKTRTASG